MFLLQLYDFSAVRLALIVLQWRQHNLSFPRVCPMHRLAVVSQGFPGKTLWIHKRR